MAPAADRSTVTCEVVPTDGFQPLIVPPSVEKMNRAAPLEGPTGNPVPPLNTSPVGPPATATVSPSFAPAALYRVDTSAWLSATHHGDVELAASPQAFTRSGSTTVPGTPSLETSAVTAYPLSPSSAWDRADAGAIENASTASANTTTTFHP